MSCIMYHGNAVDDRKVPQNCQLKDRVYLQLGDGVSAAIALG